MKDTFLNNLNTDLTIIEQNTIEQSSSSLWHSERRKRLTASKFGRIFKLRDSTNRTKIIKELLIGSFSGNKYTNYGIDNEPRALAEFSKYMEKAIFPCGLKINAKYSYLAASPDGIIGEDLVEVKCPYTVQSFQPKQAIIENKIKFAYFDENNTFRLKRNHPYYYQVQGQLFISDKKYCYFVFWTPKGFLYEKIGQDIECWNKMFPKLKLFYFEFMLPALLTNDH